MVPVGGFISMDGVNPKKYREHFQGEPPRPKAADFEYNVSSSEASFYSACISTSKTIYFENIFNLICNDSLLSV
jgi:hypothetical protein